MIYIFETSRSGVICFMQSYLNVRKIINELALHRKILCHVMVTTLSVNYPTSKSLFKKFMTVSFLDVHILQNLLN